MKRVLLTLVTVLAVLAFTGTASARTKTARCAVPKLSGLTLKAARDRLSRAHCGVGTIDRPKIASGALIVSRQRPQSGARVRRGTKVAIWLKAKTAPATQAGIVRASIDPAYTQDQSDPLKVTWAYSVGDTDGTLPDGVLTLTVYTHGQIADAGGCTIDVGGTVAGGTCTLTLPQYGSYDVTVTYDSSSASVAPTTATETEDIENPNATSAPTWMPTTTTLSVGQVSVYNYTGPPPTHLAETTTTVPLVIATANPTPAFTITVTDVTTGATATGTSSGSVPCGLQFGGPSSTTTLSGCGITSMAFAYTDLLEATAATAAAFPYEASTSATVQIWSGSMPPTP